MNRMTIVVASAVLVIAVALGSHITGAANTALAQTPHPKSTSVPQVFEGLYNELETKIDEFEAQIVSEWDGKPYHDLSFFAELLPANGNSGVLLLAPNSLHGNTLYLDRLQELGVQGVEVSVTYPLLSPDFPRSDEYVQFYRDVAHEVKQRGMTLFVKVEAMFVDTDVTGGGVDYSGITFEIFKEGKRQHIETVMSEMQPDYLTIAVEPGTAATNTGLEELRNPDKVTEMVNFLLDGLDREGVLVGAGAGTWESPEFIRQLSMNTDLDYIDLHFYPLSTPYQDFFQRVLDYADIAKQNNKKVVLGEAWLYKASGDELIGGMNYTDIFRRDVFSFWEPLDRKYLEVITKLGNYKEFEFISPFWSRYFFGYIEYSEATDRLSTQKLIELVTREAVENLIAGEFTGTGMAYKEIIDSNVDNVNDLPMASFTYSCAGLACDLDGSPSFDPDGTISSYDWNFGDGKSGFEAAVSHTYTSEGTYTVTLTVTDDDGFSDTDGVVITVNPNQSPVANAGLDQTVIDDGDGYEDVPLDGTRSSDPDGSIISYEWYEGEDMIATGSTPVVNFAVGFHTVTLLVTDNGGASASDSLVITVNDASAVPMMSVSKVFYYTQGGKNKDLHLRIDVTVVDSNDNPVSGATVSIDLYLDANDSNVLYGISTGTTGSGGKVTFSSNRAPSGCYTENLNVSHPSWTWDGFSVVADPFCK